jgi:hypothetical protein
MSWTGPRLVARLFALLAVAALLAGVGMAVHQWGPHPAAPPVGHEPVPTDSVEGDPVGTALSPSDGEDEKSRWRDEIPGVDVTVLAPGRREIFLRLANTRRCTCGCGYTLAACRAYDTSCEKSLPKIVALLDSVAGGRITDADGARTRPAAVR